MVDVGVKVMNMVVVVVEVLETVVLLLMVGSTVLMPVNKGMLVVETDEGVAEEVDNSGVG